MIETMMVAAFKKSFTLGSLSWLAILGSGQAQDLDAPQVPSTSGLIIGHRAPKTSSTFEFLGIKYGQAPIGDLRFAPPERYSPPRDTIYNASYWVSALLPCTRYSRLMRIECVSPRGQKVPSTRLLTCHQRLPSEYTTRNQVSKLHWEWPQNLQ